MEIKPIAYYCTKLHSKFGVPRQSGLVPELRGTVFLEPEFCNSDAFRGIEGFDYIWLLWGFSQAGDATGWSVLVRPPILGGNRSMGVFATRSPFRPNRIGLSSVRLLGVEVTPGAVALHVAGADLADGTPVYDIKPYVEYSDSHTGVRCGFVDEKSWKKLEVLFPEKFRALFCAEDYVALCKLLELDPRPRYHNDPERVYGMPFGGYDVRFTVSLNGVLKVVECSSIK